MNNRVGFDLTRKRYGHNQQPAVIKRDDDKFAAGVMTPEQFDAMYKAILAGMVARGEVKLDDEKQPIWSQDTLPCREKPQRDAEQAAREAGVE